MRAPTFGLPRDDGPHFASGSGHRAEAAIARRRTAWSSPARGSGSSSPTSPPTGAIYSLGAVRAAIWAGAQPPGLYGMSEVLGLRAQPAG